MSRIQNILDKAERDGAVRRVRPDTAVATADAPPPASTRMVDPPRYASAHAAPPPATDFGTTAVPAPLTPSRIVAGAHIDSRLVTHATSDTAVAEQYRALRTRIVHADPLSPVNVVMVTSPSRGAGKTLTAGNLAMTMAQEWQRRICIVDADLRHPQLHRLLGLPDGPGLCDVLSGQATLEEALVTLEEHQLTVLPAGHVPAHPAELLGTTAMRRTLETLRTQYDRIVIDAAPAAPLADVRILAPLVDRVLMVVRAGVTTKPDIHEAISTLEPAKLLGFVLNDID